MLGKLLIFNLISFNTVCNTNTTTNANEIKALTRIESEKIYFVATQRNKSVQYQTTQKFFFVATLKRTNMSQTTQVKIIFCGNTDRNKFVTYHTSQKSFNWKETARSVGTYFCISGLMSWIPVVVTTLEARVKNPGARQD